MPPSRKRGRPQAPNSRAKKKHKRLDAICDTPLRPLAPPSDDDDDDQAQPRRSSRPRKAPEILDSSPVPSNRSKKKQPKPSISAKKTKKSVSVSVSLSFHEEEEESWRSRLRSRGRRGRRPTEKVSILSGSEVRVSRKGKMGKRKREIGRQDSDFVKPGDGDEDDLNELEATEEIAEEREEEDEEKSMSESKESEDSEEAAEEDEEEEKVVSDSKELESSEEAAEAREEGGDECADTVQGSEASQELETKSDDECRNIVQEDAADEELEAETSENINNNTITSEKIVKESDKASPELDDKCSCEKTVKESDKVSPISDSKRSGSRVKEGRRCGLCGRGTDGKPPKKLVKESVDTDNEAFEGSSASEEPNYDIWDGFGDETGWLGRLLGPIHDRFGIARVWVHQHCAVWSPEVYFAGLGCLKNVRAALCRGRALKCSRCGRPGATIGCRVDRCPKTYHLPCSRADGCIFDHRKFLIACNDHRRLFQPQGISYSHQIRKRKARKLKLEIRKLSNDALRKDLEAEEKWLEYCGEDEEFLKREGKRLHRDILRIAPTYIGGSSENEALYQGWESVAGLQGVIQCMKEVVILPLLYPDFFSNIGLTPPRGVLLHGYPGTGKTLVVRALIGACSRGDKRIAYFARKGADCLGKYVGDAERQLRLLFQVAEKSQPSIIFFDEIDGLAPVRSRHQDQTHSSVVSTLLSLMDGLKSRGSVIVIGATNRPEAIDPALRRPGRFDREIYFPLPSEKDRLAILSLHTQSWTNPLSGTLLSWIANQTVGYAGADLQALCTQAAMNALKRNFALKELLSSAEKGSVQGSLPSLPPLIVEERDWLAALALAPPPCSQREAGMAANDVVSSPLPMHLIPCLIQPLSLLLISFYCDERIWLPPTLSKAAKSIRQVIISSLEKRSLPTVSWKSHFDNLIQEKIIRKEIEGVLSHYGLISVPMVGCNSCVVDDDNNEQRFDSFALRNSGVNMRKSMKVTGYRALISGSLRSGQQHLAGCLLHGFMGHVEIQKVNLATISQEGHGDLLRGLTQILSKCLNLGRCVIYMPRIDLWAIIGNLEEDPDESDATTMARKPLAANSGTKTVSEIWNSFVEQVDSVCTSASLIILATCELKNQDLPLGIKKFFASNVLDADSAMPEHTIPRFFVHLDGSFHHELVINSFAAKLSDDLVRNFVQLLHNRSHPSRSEDKPNKSSTFDLNSEAQTQSIKKLKVTGSEQIDFSVKTSSRNTQNQQGLNSSQSSMNFSTLPRILPSKGTVGDSTLAIATFGYQILRYPQFAELCWVTSKLREGPCTDINGPWKGWPFNSCVMRDSSSPDKVSKDSSGVVRGLTAVGLSSYRGVYSSVREVAIEVRKVLEILAGHIRTKLLARKDRYRYLRILSQVAYLEDMVSSWAYKFQSSYTSIPSTESNSKPISSVRLSTENNPSNNHHIGSQSCVPSFPSEICTAAQDTALTGNPAKSITSNGQCIDLSEGLSNHSLLSSDIMTLETENLQDDVHTLAVEDEFCRTEGPEPNRKSESLKQCNGLETAERRPDFHDPNLSVDAAKSSSKDISFCLNGLDSAFSSRDAKLVSEQPCKAADLTFNVDDQISAASKISCFYNCCSGCLHALYVLAHDILYQCWESNGRCSTVDDINNVVSSCSLNLSAAFRKCSISDSQCSIAHRTRSKHCACQEVGSKHLEKLSCQRKASENMFVAVDCSCHLKNDGHNSTENTGNNSPFGQALTYFFKDGVLVSSEPQKDDVLHCRYDKLCLCSMVEMILAFRKPLD